MAWLFGEVWLLCLLAFLLGSAVTWLAFVGPARRAARRTPTVDHGRHPASTPPTGAHRVSAAPTPAPAPEPPSPAPIQDVNSALATLDEWRDPGRGRPPKDPAAVLDELGVGGATPRTIPAQAEPPDEADDR